MSRRPMQQTKLNAVWEILETAAYVEQLEQQGLAISKYDLIKIYRGNFLPLICDNRIAAEQVWSVVIEITFTQDGETHKDKVDWEFGTPMTFNELLKGSSRFQTTEAGLTTVWQGIGHEWRNHVKKHFGKDSGKSAITAWATASCTAMVKPVTALHRYTRAAVLLNADFRTGAYLLSSIKLSVEKHVHLVVIDVSQTTPYMDGLTTKLVTEHGGEYFAVANWKQYVKFSTEEQLTAFLDDWGNKVKITSVQVTEHE